MKNNQVGIIGFGRFGKVLHRLFRDGFEILVSSSSYRTGDLPGVSFADFEETVRRSEALFLSVPINKTEETAHRLRPLLRPGQIVVDVCSVKEMPYRILSKTLRDTGAHIWPTHPMFGPDSAEAGFKGLTWVSCEDDLDARIVAPYIAYLEKKGLTVFRTDCETHDRIAASTQGLTHLMGRYLDELPLPPTPIDTLGYKRLRAVRDQTCNDTWELFFDLMRYNRFSKEIQSALEEAVCAVSTRLGDAASVRDETLVGICGAAASDESSVLHFFKTDPSVRSELSEGSEDRRVAVLKAASADEALTKLASGGLDFAALPLCGDDEAFNIETLTAMGRHDFSAVTQSAVPVATGGTVRYIVLTRRRSTPYRP